MVLGFEAFPRRLQGVLDDWVAGKLSAEAFLNAVEWRRVWGYDSALYMPLFQFARLNRIPMVALNVERSLVSRVGREGWAGVPQDAREGLTDPAPASEGYLHELAAVAAMKRAMPPGGGDSQSAPPEPDEAAIAEVMKQPDFKRFVEAQQTWDRAFAQGIVDARRKYPNAAMVAVLGSGHVAFGYGAMHQLKDLGMKDAVSLIPVPIDSACMRVGKSFANVMFTLPAGADEGPTVERPRLGVELVQGEGAPRINRVVGNSVAEAAGLKAGDHVVRAAGVEMRSPDDLVDVVGRQAPGTWLPLGVRRDGQEIELVAKFPPRPRQG
jgi:Haem-binding uptake, Tiki superfamily, ChaN/PDZ domain